MRKMRRADYSDEIESRKSAAASCSNEPKQLQIAPHLSNKVIPLRFVPIASLFHSIFNC